MKQKPLDSQRQRMVAALYGELPPDELRELEAACAADETLQRDWEELRAARSFLQQAGREETEPDFTFVWPRDEPTARPGGRLFSAPWRWLVPAASGFAAATAVFVALLAVGLRVDRTDRGVLIHLDHLPGDPALTAAADDYVTRAEAAELARMLTATARMTALRLDELELRQAGEQTAMARELYAALSQRQQRQYDDLRTRIELTPYRAAALLEPQLQPRSMPVQQTPYPNGGQGNEKY
ncbi:MAG: hypothetical protein GY856_08455 [bacterium]|nr:hypothetical protein [bacterium]